MNNTDLHDLRNSDMKLNLPFPKTEYLKKSISFNGVKLWNNLPIEVRNAESLGIFNSLLCATSLSGSTSFSHPPSPPPPPLEINLYRRG